jgi:DNA end-binding protein Ku
MATRALDSATLAFGLVSIPINIYSTNEPSHHVSFHMIHQGCGQRLHQRYVCPKHGEIERDDIAKGYEYAKGKHVELDKAELKALDAVASDAVELVEFVPALAVDPLYVDASYYIGPTKGGEAAYRLLAEAMTRSELVGIASYAARGKQYVVMVRPFEDGLIMHQLRYPDEVKPWSEVPMPKLPRPKDAQVAMAQQLIGQITSETFDPSKYKDEVKKRVKALINQKVKGKDIEAPAPVKPAAEVVDLMEALKASLAGGGKARASGRRVERAKRVAAKKPATARKRKRAA